MNIYFIVFLILIFSVSLSQAFIVNYFNDASCTVLADQYTISYPSANIQGSSNKCFASPSLDGRNNGGSVLVSCLPSNGNLTTFTYTTSLFFSDCTPNGYPTRSDNFTGIQGTCFYSQYSTFYINFSCSSSTSSAFSTCTLSWVSYLFTFYLLTLF